MNKIVWTIGMVGMIAVVLASGCAAQGRTGTDISLSAAENREVASLISENAGGTPYFQSSASIAEWSPEGLAIIRELMDGVLPTLNVTGKLPADTSAAPDHIFARYGDGVTFYFPIKSKTPERQIVAHIQGQWYSVSGDKQKVARLLKWASTQSIY